MESDLLPFFVLLLDIGKLCRHQINFYSFAYTITMYEVTVSVTNEQKYLLDSICQDMFDYIRQVDGTCANLQGNHRSYFCLACSDTYTNQVKRLLTDSVARILTLGYKNIFVRQLLEIDNNNFYQNVLVDTMCVFDHQYEMSIVANFLDCNRDIYLDGYYHFRMQSIKRKWEKVVDMILENNYILLDNALIVEFLQCLLQSADGKMSQLSICFDGDTCTLYDCKGKVLAPICPLSQRSTAEQQAIVNAICLSPQKVQVLFASKPSKEFCDLANALFDVRYVMVQ